MSLQISGRVFDLDTGEGVPGLRVRVMDRDLLFDDELGEGRSREDGGYRIGVTDGAGGELLGDRPDVYLVVLSDEGAVLASTRDDIRFDVTGDLRLDVPVFHARLVAAGLAEPLRADWMDGLDPEASRALRTWTWREDEDAGDEEATALRGDLEARSSVLELMRSYIEELEGTVDNEAGPFPKLRRLFELGRTPERVEGHCYGLPVMIRTGDLNGLAAGFGNILGFLYGTLIADTCAWVGKSMTPMAAAERDRLTERALAEKTPAFAGINHFNRMELRLLNEASFHLLSFWMGQTNAPEPERRSFGHEKNGGRFVAYRNTSVYGGTPREVFQLNYRWNRLDNPPPFRWLVDELVQVAEGLWLGQLLFSTRRLTSGFEPGLPAEEYGYQHFGYFLLWDERWNAEARRLFPHLDMPVHAPGLEPVGEASAGDVKFRTFTFAESPPTVANDRLLEEIREEMRRRPTILHLLKGYSDELNESFDNESTAFARLRELFNRGVGIRELEGRFRGALVSWHSEGLMRVLDVNLLNLAWMRVGAGFSTWTGKTFESIPAKRLEFYTDGRETGELPTFWGSNTQALRTPRERFVGRLLELAGVPGESVPPETARAFGFDLLNFFFIARRAGSVNPDNAGKEIFQFNYRWPKLETMPPDCYCLDELVQIADGLYLGQLMYATNLTKAYDPDVDPGEYRYRLFGYFLLMDDEWHQVRLDIGFDLENA